MALVQTRRIIALLEAEAKRTGSGDTFVLHEVVSEGCFERFQGHLHELGGKGAFVKALACELVAGQADMAMHSLKDVPGDAEMPPELCLPCMLPREDLRDAVVTRVGESFVGLKAGAKIGTNSVRRAAQLRANFPHLNVVPLRGNADTRVQRVDDGVVDAAMLALAGLRRIGLDHRVCSVFEPDVLMPAVGQGVVTVQCRQDDAAALALLARINHADTMTCVTAERAMLAALEGDCHSPIGGYCEVTKGGNLRLLGLVSSLDGLTVLHGRGKAVFSNPVALGQAVAQDLLAQGAGRLLRP